MRGPAPLSEVRCDYSKLITQRNRKGYLLLEVVVSIAVVAIGLVVILRSFSSSLRASKIAQEYFDASLALQGTLCALEEKEKLEEGVAAGETAEEVAGTPYSLETKITRISDLDRLNEVNAVIYWKNRDRNEKIEIGTYLKNK